VEIIVIDDQSAQPVQLNDAGVRLIRMEKRVGGGVARHIGALHAKRPYLLFTDAHMRFKPGWYEAAMNRIAGREGCAHVGKCLGLSETNMDLDKAQGAYCGAKINFIAEDPNRSGVASVMEGVWDGPKKDDQEVECFMGACYFWPKELFLKLVGKRGNFH
jgi:glycosyltransferase involved in cell wall biosynthesis